MTAETVVTRLHRLAERQASLANPGLVSLDLADAQALLAIIAETCDQHEQCSICEAPLCETCGIGEIHTCADFHLIVHCPDCVMECRACRDEAQGVRDAEYDREAERAL